MVVGDTDMSHCVLGHGRIWFMLVRQEHRVQGTYGVEVPTDLKVVISSIFVDNIKR